MPAWAREISTLYESGANSQFLLYGNVNDRLLLPSGRLGDLHAFLVDVLLAGFDVVLSYDIGNGIRIEKGGEIFSEWSRLQNHRDLPREPLAAVGVLTHYLRYCANLGRMGKRRIQVGCCIHAAHLMVPVVQGGYAPEISAAALLIRDWASDGLLTEHPMATFLIAENRNDINPLIVNNPRIARIRVPLPGPDELRRALDVIAAAGQVALSAYREDLAYPARQLAGTTLSAMEALLKIREFNREPLRDADLARLKKDLVENDASGLIEFIESHRSLDDIQGLDGVKRWLREDLALWRRGDLEAVPKGYLLCGPVGTGKTFLVECLAGEAGVPIVRLKNFRDRWVGSSEGNLEKIFRLLAALGRCYVFIDEADQALGRRGAGAGDGGVSGRLYSMIAEEMSRPDNRGRVIWVLASSRPDLIEVDLKRPGRIDIRIPLFPTHTTRASYELVCALCRKRDLDLSEEDFAHVEAAMPLLLTPAAAETIAVKVYRLVRTRDITTLEALQECLKDYRAPVDPRVMEAQIRLAMDEATDPSLIPAYFRQTYTADSDP